MASPRAGRQPRIWLARRPAGRSPDHSSSVALDSHLPVPQHLDTARPRQRWRAADGGGLKADGANLASRLLHLRRHYPAHYGRVCATFRQVAPYFAEFAFDDDALQADPDPTLLLQWRETGSDLLFGANQMSDGTLRTLALLAVLLQPSQFLPALLVLDEPEIGLHPYALELVAGLIRAVALDRQVLVCTQSPDLLCHFDAQDVVAVERRGRQTELRRLDTVSLAAWLNEYSLGDLWLKGVLGGRPTA